MTSAKWKAGWKRTTLRVSPIRKRITPFVNYSPRGKINRWIWHFLFYDLPDKAFSVYSATWCPLVGSRDRTRTFCRFDVDITVRMYICVHIYNIWYGANKNWPTSPRCFWKQDVLAHWTSFLDQGSVDVAYHKTLPDIIFFWYKRQSKYLSLTFSKGGRPGRSLRTFVERRHTSSPRRCSTAVKIIFLSSLCLFPQSSPWGRRFWDFVRCFCWHQ